MKSELILASLFFILLSCDSKTKFSEIKAVRDFYVVPGEDEPIDSALIKKGQVLVAYSDCYQCHKEEDRAKGPSFADIARRYPIQDAYLDMLAQKIISGGTGVWGYPVMSAHPNLSHEDARLMAFYILSLEKKRPIRR